MVLHSYIYLYTKAERDQNQIKDIDKQARQPQFFLSFTINQQYLKAKLQSLLGEEEFALR